MTPHQVYFEATISGDEDDAQPVADGISLGVERWVFGPHVNENHGLTLIAGQVEVQAGNDDEARAHVAGLVTEGGGKVGMTAVLAPLDALID